MESEADTDRLHAAVTAAFPGLAEAPYTVSTAGWDSVALDVDGRMIFRFPRRPQAEASLKREARLLDAVRPAVTLAVPNLAIHHGPPLFSFHAKIPGDHLVTAQYERLPEDARQRLAEAIAQFYAELHGLEAEHMAAAGATPIKPWLTPEEIARKALPLLTGPLRAWAERRTDAFAHLQPDPHGTVYGFFDGHGWNMAFDHGTQRLNGIYDFGDSGVGPLHQDFIYTNFIAPDLTARIMTRYETLTGRVLDRGRIALLTAAHRLSEMAELADDAHMVPTMRKNVADWARLA